MLSYALLSSVAKGFCMLWALLLVFASFYAFVCFFQQKRKAMHFLSLALSFTASYLLLHLMLDYFKYTAKNRQPVPLTQLFASAPVAFVTAVSAALTVIVSAQLYSAYHWGKNNISPSSVKESVDLLESGLCYYYPSGLPKLINKKAEEQFRTLTGKSPSDMNALWNELKSGNVSRNVKVIRTGENPIFGFSDSQIISFSNTPLSFGESEINEIISADITEEYSVSLELEEKKKAADLINKRLRDLNKDITRMTIEKEVLNTKIRVHDELGGALLLTQRYLHEPSAVNRDELLEVWKKNVMLLKNERPEHWQEVYMDSFRKAALLGVEVEISGHLPENREYKNIIDLAVNTCATNIIRYAKGNAMYISFDGRTVSIKNNGAPPETEITEGGGLKNLRKIVEKSGGKMTVHSTPEFELIIELKED